MTERVNALAPDLIAVTGDLVDGSVKHLGDEVAPFAALRAEHGVFFVTGNHDYYSGADPWLEVVRHARDARLRNERVEIRRDDAVFDLAGVDDHRGYLFGPGHGEDVARALRRPRHGACRSSCSRTTPRRSRTRRRSASTCSSPGTRTAGRSGPSATSSGWHRQVRRRPLPARTRRSST